MRSFTCFYGHGQGLGRAHGHGQGLGRAHGHGQGLGRAHGFLLHFYDDFYRYVAGQVSLAKSVPPYNYEYGLSFFNSNFRNVITVTEKNFNPEGEQNGSTLDLLF